jgi:hypothetical protein
MTNQHPITPPPELVLQWQTDWHHSKSSYVEIEVYIATEAARWGADQELEACCRWTYVNGWDEDCDELRAARRPKPPSLKEQALAVVENALFCDHLNSQDEAILRRVLEQLPND